MYSLAFAVVAVAVLATSVPSRASQTDDRIESSFKKTYVYKTYLKDEHIKISSKDNRIEYTGDRAAENSDTWVSMKVKTALLFHRNVNAHKTEVYVKDGIVTLKGEASSPAQRDLTTEFAKDVAGVKEVKNEMTVAAKPEKPETMGENIDDASITAQVKATLLSHRSTGVLRTKVETNDGVVTLGGQARNAAEKDLVTKLVEDVHGVKSVVNNMTIEEAKKE
jgi:osmotically-inducible protein OsmY